MPPQLLRDVGAKLRRLAADASVALAAMFDEPISTTGIPGYTCGVAKVMISLPDDLLARLDVDAQGRQLSRSALIREYIESAQAERNRQLAMLMAEIDDEPLRGHGGDVVADLKAARAELKR